MADPEATGRLVDEVEDELGPIDILVLNAGINTPVQTDPRRISVAEWDRAMAALIATDMLPGDEASRAGLASRIPVGRLGRSDEVADLIAAIVSNAYVTNQSILIDGGMRPS